MAFQMRMPGAESDDVRKSIRQIRSWLYQLNENLQYTFSNLDEENFTETFLKTLGVSETPTLTEQIKALGERMDAAETGVWTTLTVQNASAWSDFYIPCYKKYGKTVYLSGGIRLNSSLASSSSVNIGVLPAGYRPTLYMSLCAASDAGAVMLTLDPSGTVTVKNVTGHQLSTSDFVSLGCSFPA